MAEMAARYSWPAATLSLWAQEGHLSPIGGGEAKRGAKYDPSVVYQVAQKRQQRQVEQCREISKKPRQALRVDGVSKAEASLQWSVARAQRAKLELAARSSELVTTACVESLLGMLGRIANEGHSQTRNKLTAMVGADALQVLDDEHARTMRRMVEEIRGHRFSRWGEDEAGANPLPTPGTEGANQPTKASQQNE